MLPALISALAPALGTLIERLVPDKEEAAKVKAEMELRLIEAANQASLAQLDVNRAEAVHRSIFVAGWRPAIGWICAAALGWTYIGAPLLGTALLLLGHEPVAIPTIDLSYLMELLLGMLGLAGMRSWEKSRGLTR